MIDLRQISKIYNAETVPTPALVNIDLSIQAGEFVAIMGPSGSGKSTLMHILGFLDKPTSGEYWFDKKLVGYEDDDYLAELRNKKIGFVFQSFNLLPRTSVLENIKLPLIYAHIHHSEANRRALHALKAVGLEHRLHHLSNQLSGGEKQRVAIARALINNPKVIFADEPTGNLDSKSGEQIMAILQALNNQGHTIILVTHELFAAESAKRIIALKDGKIVKDHLVAHRRIMGKDNYIK